jgi:hypothetical protein
LPNTNSPPRKSVEPSLPPLTEESNPTEPTTVVAPVASTSTST